MHVVWMPVVAAKCTGCPVIAAAAAAGAAAAGARGFGRKGTAHNRLVFQ